MKTRKIVLSTLIAASILFTVDSSVAQSTSQNSVKGKNFINLGIGVGTFGFTGTGGLPIVASIEHGFADKISGGAYLGFINRKFGASLKYSYKVFGAKAAYHFNEALNINNDNIDTYGGAAIYYRSFSLRYQDHEDPAYDQKSTGGDVGIGVFAGGRYFFSRKAGAFAEIGYGISPLQLGVTIAL